MTVIERSGNGADPWCAVAAHPSGWAFVWNNPGFVRFEFADGRNFSRAVPGDFLRYLDAASNPIGEVTVIGVGNDDSAYLVGSWFPDALALDKVFGNFPVGVYWDGQTFVPVQVVSATHYTRNRGPRDLIRIGATSQGIRQVLLDSSIIWGDETHVLETHGRTIHKYAQLGHVLAGQRNGPDHIDLYDGQWWTPIHGSAQPPRLVQLANGYGVCAATNHGAVLAVGPPWPILLPDATPPPDPDPDPIPEPEPPPMAIPNCLSSVTRARAGFLTPLGVQHASCLIAIVQAIKADHPEVDPGLLRKDSGTRITMPDGTEVAQDIICFPDGHHFDCLHDGENAASPTWQDKGFVDADRYYRVPGSAPPPPPPPSDDCDEVRAQLRVVMGELAQATGALTACRAEHESARVEIERLLAEIERLKQEKPPCQCKIDGNATIARIFGIRCRPI